MKGNCCSHENHSRLPQFVLYPQQYGLLTLTFPVTSQCTESNQVESVRKEATATLASLIPCELLQGLAIFPEQRLSGAWIWVKHPQVVGIQNVNIVLGLIYNKPIIALTPRNALSGMQRVKRKQGTNVNYAVILGTVFLGVCKLALQSFLSLVM